MKKLLLLSLFCTTTAMADVVVTEQMGVGKVIQVTATNEISQPIFVNPLVTAGVNILVSSGLCNVQHVVDLPSKILAGTVPTWISMIGPTGPGARGQATSNTRVAIRLDCTAGTGVITISTSS